MRINSILLCLFERRSRNSFQNMNFWLYIHIIIFVNSYTNFIIDSINHKVGGIIFSKINP